MTKTSSAIKTGRIVAAILLGLCVVPMVFSAAGADECRSNRFQPTFVRHNALQPRVYYVEPNGNFTLMRSPADAQATCRARGVRQAIGGGTCFQRNWGDFGCGCNITPSPNRTCARFQALVASITRGATSVQFCRNLYASGDAENRAGNTARAQNNIAGARSRYQRALALFRQGANNPRCGQFRAQFNNAAAIVGRNLQRVAGGMQPPRPNPPNGQNANATMRVVGNWHWFTGKPLRINVDHTMVGPTNSGTWSYLGNNVYVFRWVKGGFVDRLTWSPGPPPRLNGKNNLGGHVWGTQTRGAGH